MREKRKEKREKVALRRLNHAASTCSHIMNAQTKFDSPSIQFLWDDSNVALRPRWSQLIWEGELTLLDGRPEEAEKIYFAALKEAKTLPAEDNGWFKIGANLRYLYVNYLCHPLTPDILYKRTVPLWSEILGPEHRFIVTWSQSIDAWSEREK